MDDGIKSRVPHIPPRNHVVLLVRSLKIGPHVYLVDVGFGVRSLQGAIRLEDGAEVVLEASRYQLRKRVEATSLQACTLHEVLGDRSCNGWMDSLLCLQRVTAAECD